MFHPTTANVTCNPMLARWLGSRVCLAMRNNGQNLKQIFTIYLLCQFSSSYALYATLPIQVASGSIIVHLKQGPFLQ